VRVLIRISVDISSRPDEAVLIVWGMVWDEVPVVAVNRGLEAVGLDAGHICWVDEGEGEGLEVVSL
jgi:hypothetical protein